MSQPDEYDEDDEFTDDDEPAFEMTADSMGAAAAVRGRDEALDSGLPVLMLHRGARHFKRLHPLAAELQAANGASLSLGAVISLPRVKPEAALEWLEEAVSSSVRIADPEAYARPDMWGPALLVERDGPARPPKPGEKPARPLMPRTAAQWEYWSRPLPAGPDDAWVREVLDAQRRSGANLLLTPGVPLDAAAPAESLRALEQHTAWARSALTAGERLAVNVTADSTWLSDPRLRDALLDSVVESDEATWYLRVKWPQQSASYGQLVDGAVLDGYRETATFMEDEDRVLLLPTTGGTGWVSLAWGATGFGTGIGSKERHFVTGRPIRMKERPPTVPRYFERPLLHSIEQTTAARLARLPGHVPCVCRYCGELKTEPVWRSDLSGAHYVLTVGGLTASLAGHASRRAAARKAVRDATRFAAHVQNAVPLAGNDIPAHLASWLERLR